MEQDPSRCQPGAFDPQVPISLPFQRPSFRLATSLHLKNTVLCFGIENSMVQAYLALSWPESDNDRS
jgi:hypothetical protein